MRISSPSIVLILLEQFKLMLHSNVHIDIVHLHLIQNQVQSQKNSQDCIFHLTFPSPLPIVALSWLCLLPWAFWLVVWVEASAIGHLSILVDGVDQHLSFVLYKRSNQVPNHIFLPFGWRFALPFYVLLLEEPLLL